LPARRRRRHAFKISGCFGEPRLECRRFIELLGAAKFMLRLIGSVAAERSGFAAVLTLSAIAPAAAATAPPPPPAIAVRRSGSILAGRLMRLGGDIAFRRSFFADLLRRLARSFGDRLLLGSLLVRGGFAAIASTPPAPAAVP
jgi:hypothetical protein